jgi:hypothetical protein
MKTAKQRFRAAAQINTVQGTSIAPQKSTCGAGRGVKRPDLNIVAGHGIKLALQMKQYVIEPFQRVE